MPTAQDFYVSSGKDEQAFLRNVAGRCFRSSKGELYEIDGTIESEHGHGTCFRAWNLNHAGWVKFPEDKLVYLICDPKIPAAAQYTQQQATPEQTTDKFEERNAELLAKAGLAEIVVEPPPKPAEVPTDVILKDMGIEQKPRKPKQKGQK